MSSDPASVKPATLNKFPDTFTYTAIKAAQEKEKLEQERAAEEGFEDADQFRARIVNSFDNKFPYYIDATRVKKAAIDTVIGELLDRFLGELYYIFVNFHYECEWKKVDKRELVCHSRLYAITDWKGALKDADAWYNSSTAKTRSP